MPQMMPMSWLILYIMFLMIFILFNLMNYFVNIKENNPNKMMLKTKYNTWKW